MFWKNLCTLCNAHGTTPNAVCLAIGKSSATATKWKNGAVPRDTTLQLVANYFNVTPEELLRDPAEQTALTETTTPQTDHPMLDARFYELLDQLTLKELRDLKAQMEETIKNRK